MGNNPVNIVDPTGGEGGPARKNPSPNPDIALGVLAANGTSFLDAVTVTPDNPSPWQVGWEWLTGTGPRDRAFMDGDSFTEMLKQHEHIQDVKEKIATALSTGSELPSKPEDLNYALGGLGGIPKYIRDYSTLATAGKTGNLAATYLGSYTVKYKLTNVDIQNKTATIHFRINNSSTIESATHPPVLGYFPIWGEVIGEPLNEFFSSGPLSKTTQTFEWTETIKWE